MELQEGDLVLCTVEKIERTIVFVKIEVPGKNLQGSIITSEIAPGRIRNMREYVVPKKKIVCKILRISGDRIELSLRRVSQKERKEVMEEHKQEKSYTSILKTILAKDTEKIINKIQEKERLYDFIEEAKTDSKGLEKVVGKEKAKKILDIVLKQKKKKIIVKKEFKLTSTNPNGLETIKKLLATKEAEIRYISAGKYSIKIESEDVKKADNKIKEILNDLSEKAKKQDMKFEIKER